jgi:hypothetical protein
MSDLDEAKRLLRIVLDGFPKGESWGLFDMEYEASLLEEVLSLLEKMEDLGPKIAWDQLCPHCKKSMREHVLHCPDTGRELTPIDLLSEEAREYMKSKSKPWHPGEGGC